MGWIKCVRCEKSRRDFVSRTFVLTAPVQYVLHQVSCSYEMIPNAPKYCETDRNISLGPTWLIGCVRCEKSRRDFAAPTFALIAPVHPVFTEFHALTKWSQMHPNIKCVDCEKLQRDFVAQTFALVALVLSILQQVSCSYETIPNAPKYYETDRSISLGSNGADWVCSLRKNLRATNFCINCTTSTHFVPSFMQLRNDPKCSRTLWNAPKHEFWVQWDGSGALVEKNYTWLRSTNFCINCASSVCFVTSFMQLRNDPKCTQILRNRPKH